MTPGSRFGPYEIRERLGAGGMGEVYLAWDTRLRREVALKFLQAGDRPLLNEARLAARVDHPGVCAIYEVGEHDGRDFIAMQRVPGTTLETRLPGRPLPEPEAVGLAIQVADALAAAHAQGVIHRDLKAQNVMITPEGRAVVLDFGIARGAETASDDVTVTAYGAVSGTPSAMSPEQARGEKLDARTDVFSFGALLYRMLSGRDPFRGATPADAIAAVLRHDPPPLAGVSPELARIVHKCLEKDRELRYGSMREVRVDLERLVRGAPARSRRFRGALPVGLGILLAAVAVAVFWHPWRTTSGVRTLAVLPFRALGGEESYLGLGIADAVISRVSQDTGLVVRPTSAIRKFAIGNASASDAAKELRVDVILEGTWQQEGDRLRVTANLLRRTDGVSLWSDRFDAASTDLFAIQDRISDQLAERLRSRLTAAGPPGATSGGTINPAAYEAYSKGLYYFSERGFNEATRGNSDQAIRLFAEAIRLDPVFARAHAQLAHAYVWTALFIEQDSTWIAKAEQELAEAERIDPGLALVPLVRSQILFSRYAGWQMQDAIVQLRRARELEPGIGALEWSDLAFHLGIEDAWRKGMDRALEEDPMSHRLKSVYVNNAYGLLRFELGKKLQKDLLDEEPGLSYWAATRDLKRLVPDIEGYASSHPGDPIAMTDLALLRAMQDRCHSADSLVHSYAGTLVRDRQYHHATYQIAQTYGLCGDVKQTVHWLEITLAWGFPALPLFERDPWFDSVRRSPEFVAFLARIRPQWEKDREALLRN